MNIIISGRHVSVTEPMKDYARKKAEKLLRHFEGVINVHVTLSIENNRHIAEIVASTPRSNTLIADFTDSDMYAAIDGSVDRIERQLTKYKEKLKDKRPRKKLSEREALAGMSGRAESESEVEGEDSEETEEEE